MSEPMPRVVLADDHLPIRVGVEDALTTAGFEVVASVPDARRAVTETLRHRPDVALLDVSMPGDGLRAAEEIAELAPDTAVVMLTSYAGDDLLLRAVRAGALGYLVKDLTPDRLVEALHGVLRGEAAIPPALVRRLLGELRRDGRATRGEPDPRTARVGPLVRRWPRGTRLTLRELEVLDMLRRGMSTAEIARALVVSPVTVRGHVSRVLKKLGAEDREAALRRLAELQQP